MADLNKYVQTNTFYLAGSGSIIGATSIALTSLTDIYGNVLTMTDFGTTGYITFEPDTTNEESATFTGVSANANGTYTLTGLSTTLAKDPYTQTSGLIRQHSGGTKVVVTDNVAFWATFANKANDETITGTWLVPTGGTGTQVANATDIANAVSGASGTATNLVFGTVKLSVAAASGPNPIVVGDNDSRMSPATGTSGGILGYTGATTLASSVLLTNHALILGAGAGATPTPLGSLGTTTTVLHGNASGAPTFGAVSLTLDVSGTLPVANGGTGSSSLPFAGLFKDGGTTKNAGDASTTQNIAHGLGIAPKYVRINCLAQADISVTNFKGVPYANAVYNGTTQSSWSVWVNGATDVTADNSFTLNSIQTGGGASQVGVITFDATNIIITWTKTGSPSGIYTVTWEAFA